MGEVIALPGRAVAPAPAQSDRETERHRRAALELRQSLLEMSSSLTNLKTALSRLRRLMAEDTR
jgi:hypothetical protein